MTSVITWVSLTQIGYNAIGEYVHAFVYHELSYTRAGYYVISATNVETSRQKSS